MIGRWLAVVLFCAAAPTLAQPEPPVGPEGGDRSAFPARHAEASWLPLEAPVLGGRLEVRVEVNGQRTVATLDTGATRTTMDEATATALGLLRPGTPFERMRVRDANDNVTTAVRVPLGVLAVGAHKWADVTVGVIPSPQRFFLVGMDILESVDLLVVAHEGLVGVFEAGKAPHPRGGRAVRYEYKRHQLLVRGDAPSQRGRRVRFGFLLDTGAMGTSVPVKVGIDGGLPAHVGLSAVWSGISSRQERRGAFVLKPLRLGSERVVVGPILATGATLSRGEGRGLLGMDVLGQQVTLISPARRVLVLGERARRPSFRTRGPGGSKCAGDDGRCLEVGVRERGGKMHLDVDVQPAFQGRVTELAITFEDAAGEPLLNGGALSFYVTSGPKGYKAQVPIDELRVLGLDARARARLAWVRVKGVTWPCDALATHCVLWPTWMGAIKKP